MFYNTRGFANNTGGVKTIEEIGLRLRKIRKFKNIPLKVVGCNLGVHASTISDWELGNHEMSLSKFLSFCEAIGCKPADILS